MRHPFQAPPNLQLTPIEKIRLPLKSREELPPLLAGLQWIWMHPTLKAEILALLEAAGLTDKQATGRPGMNLWQILVLGVVRLGLAADWDRMEHIANDDALVRQRLEVPAAPWGEEDKIFGHQTLRDNVALLDDELLQAINARIAAAGREGFAKKAGAPGAALEIKVDSDVLETDVPFPTDLNLTWEAGRKCVDWVEGFRASGYALPGWRKFKAWRRHLKNLQRTASQIVYRGGANQEARVKQAVREYLTVGRARSAKVGHSLLELCAPVRLRHALGETRLLPHAARPTSGPGGTPVVERGKNPGAREIVFPLRAAHRMDPERQAATERRVGPQIPDRDRSESIDPGLRRVDERIRKGSKPPGDRSAAGAVGRGQRGEPEFRQGFYARGGSGVVEFIGA